MPNASASASASMRPAATISRGHVLLVVSAIAFSTSGLFARLAPVDVWAMVFWRNLFGVAALIPFVVASRQRRAQATAVQLGWAGWITLVASAVATICYLAAFGHTSVAHVAIIYATAPLASALLAWVWIGERATRSTLAAAVLALAGVAVTVAGAPAGAGGGFGDGLALLMTLAMAVMTVAARRHAKLPALPTACLASLLAALAVLPLGWACHARLAVSWREAAWLAAFGVTSMAVALPCYLSGAATVPAGPAMLISALELPLAPLWVWLVLAERPAAAALLGGATVAVAVVWQMAALSRPGSHPGGAAHAPRRRG